MAELGALYEIVPVPRTAHDVMASAEEKTKVKGPEAERKWLVASVVDDAASVIAQVFDEAERARSGPRAQLGRPRRRQLPPDRPDGE